MAAFDSILNFLLRRLIGNELNTVSIQYIYCSIEVLRIIVWSILIFNLSCLKKSLKVK